MKYEFYEMTRDPCYHLYQLIPEGFYNEFKKCWALGGARRGDVRFHIQQYGNKILEVV